MPKYVSLKIRLLCVKQRSLQSADHPDLAVFATSSTMATGRSVLINGVCLDILIDAGVEVNILPLSAGVPTDLQPCTVAVQSWGKFDIPVREKATCDVNYKGKTVRLLAFQQEKGDTHNAIQEGIKLIYEKLVNILKQTGVTPMEIKKAEFIIVTPLKDRNTMLPLFSLEICQRLGMIHELLQVSNINVFKDYNDRFTGLGVLNTGFEFIVPIDNTVPAKNVPARRLPPAVLEPVRAELKRMEQYSAIRPITEPTKWCSPMLVTRKKTGDIRLVVDFREIFD